jgi:hypothetical protein
MAKENPLWGYKRIQGELKKLDIEISASSIRRIIAPKRRPGPKRDTWCQFMRNQAASIIACDLFTVETVRLKTLHVLFFIDLNTRKVLIGGVTDGATNLSWCTQIARNLSEAREAWNIPIKFLVHDRDKRFGASFDEVSKAEESGSSARLGGRHERMPTPSDSFGPSAPNVSTESSSSTKAISARCSRPTSITTTGRGRTEGSTSCLPMGHRTSSPSPPPQAILDEGIGLAD